MKNIFLLSFICLLTACSQSTDRAIKTFNINLDSSSDLTEFIQSEQIIPLEINDDCLIGEIGKLCVDSLYLYIMDSKNDEVFIFDKKGSYVSQIFARGNGPDQYIELSDIAVENQKIYILSRPNKKIYIYGIDGQYKKMIPLNDWYHRFYVSNDKIVLYSCKANQQLHDIVSIDLQGNIINKYMPFATNESFLFNIYPFNVVGENDCLLCFPYERRVALLNDEGCDYLYKFDFDTSINFSDEEMDILEYDQIRKTTLHKEALKQIESITQDNSKEHLFIISTIFLDGKGLRKVLCKVNLKTQESKIYIVGDKTDQEYPLFYNPILLQENKIYCNIRQPSTPQNRFEEKNPAIGIYEINWKKQSMP